MIVLQATPHRIKRIWHGDAVGFSALGLWNSYVFLLKVALMQTHECIRLKTVTRTPTPVTFLQNWWLALFPLSLSLRACRLSFLPVLMSRSCYGFGCGPNPNLKDVRRYWSHPIREWQKQSHPALSSIILVLFQCKHQFSLIKFILFKPEIPQEFVSHIMQSFSFE